MFLPARGCSALRHYFGETSVRPPMKLSGFLLFVMAASTAAGGPDIHACEAPADLSRLYVEIKQSIHRVEMLQDKLATDPDNLFLNRWYLESPQIRQGSLADDYRKKLEEHPDDP